MITFDKSKIEIEFKELQITCDGKHTHIIVDNKDIASGCSFIQFTHDINAKPEITLYKTIKLIPQDEPIDPKAFEEMQKWLDETK